MRILVLASDYPYPGYPFAGIFIEKCVLALKGICDYIEVVAPRPYVPKLLALKQKWKIYSNIVACERRNGITIHRPPVLVIPKIGSASWSDYGTYLFCRKFIRRLHHQVQFDVIFSYGLSNAGNLAWRVGKDIGVPSCGWASGDDVRVCASASSGNAVIRTINNLNLVFYQSYELLGEVAKLIKKTTAKMLSEEHIVLSHGITMPNSLASEKMRKSIRAKWGVSNNEIVVLSLGRVAKEKGIFELLDAISIASSLNRKITCIIVGSIPLFYDSVIVTRKLENDPILRNRVQMLPFCDPSEIWDIYSGADIFAFTSYKEGMPNTLLEAMATGLPAIAFSIPPVEELDAGTDSLIKVPPFDSRLFAEAILRLADSPEQRKVIGSKGRKHVKNNFDININMDRAMKKIRKVINK